LNHFRLEIPTCSENESLARVAVAALAAQLDPTLEDINDIKTAVSEAVTNAIIHGYSEGSGDIIIYAEISKDELMVEITDHGKGIQDLDQARKPLFTTRPDLEMSGMGFTIMENFMDRVEVETNIGEGVVVRMWKKISSQAKDAGKKKDAV